MVCVSSAMLFAFLTSPVDAATRPAVPTGLVARAGNSTAVLTWSPAKHATHYRVCLLTAKKQKKCGLASGRLTEPTLRINKLTPRSGTDYYFRVYAYRGSERSGSALKGFELQRLVTPGVPTGVKQAVTTSALTITWAAAKNAQDYRVCLMTGAASTSCSQASARSATRTAKFTGLKPTGGGDYFYRVEAYNRTKSSRSALHRVDLPVGPVSGVTATDGGAGAFQTSWTAATNAEEYELQVATNAAMTSSLRTFTTRATSITPTIPIGSTWFYRVRGLNGVQKGAFTPAASLRLPSTAATIRVMTYNLCGQDKCVTTANKMKKWSTRRTYAGEIVRGSDADIIATQESHDKDTQFIRELPGFGLAAYYSAKSLFYDRAKYDVVRSGTITLSKAEKKYAVWAEFRDKPSRNRFIVVDAHLQPYKGKTYDDMRAAQSKILINQTASINTTRIPVIYAGDYNSNKSNADQSRYKGGHDAPYKAFLAAGIPDTYTTAERLVHADYNSANQAKNPPLRHSDHVDHIFADPEIAVVSWRVWATLNGTSYVTPFATDHNPVRAVLRIPGR